MIQKSFLKLVFTGNFAYERQNPTLSRSHVSLGHTGALLVVVRLNKDEGFDFQHFLSPYYVLDRVVCDSSCTSTNLAEIGL